METVPTRDDTRDDIRARGHAWWPSTDNASQCHIWRCTCTEVVYQPFGAPVPDELISHPQSFGQMRGELRETARP